MVSAALWLQLMLSSNVAQAPVLELVPQVLCSNYYEHPDHKYAKQVKKAAKVNSKQKPANLKQEYEEAQAQEGIDWAREIQETSFLVLVDVAATLHWLLPAYRKICNNSGVPMNFKAGWHSLGVKNSYIKAEGEAGMFKYYEMAAPLFGSYWYYHYGDRRAHHGL